MTFLLVSLALLALDLELFALVELLYIFFVKTIKCPSLEFEFELYRTCFGTVQWRLYKQTTPARRQKLKYAE